MIDKNNNNKDNKKYREKEDSVAKKNNLSYSDADDKEYIEKIKKERDEYLEGWKRTKADFLNYKKDEAKRIENLIHVANEQLIKELLPVLDSFDLAIESLGEDSKSQKGMYLIKSQFEDTLKKFGLEKIRIVKGEHFNPSLHEAVMSVDSKEESGVVVEEVESGYMLNGKVIRASKVKVSK